MPSPHPPPDSALVAGMREGREAAYTGFVRRWQPLLSDGARRLGLAPDDADDLVADVLVEAAAAFGAGRAAPRAMGAYLMTALRNRARNHWRDEARRRAREEAAWAEAALDGGVGGAAEAAVGGPVDAGVAGASDGVEAAAEQDGGPGGVPAGGLGGGRGGLSTGAVLAVREPAASAAPAEPDDAPVPPPPLVRLAEALTRGLSRDERLLLVWSGHHVPHRTIAEWLGSSPGAVSKRIERLRARLRRAALAHLEDVPALERAVLVRFLRRADLTGADAPRTGVGEPSGGGDGRRRTAADVRRGGADGRPAAADAQRAASSRSGEE